ncbi:MAG TPA: metalloregulator ArsR/SmtB family transcription factor [Candidatus Deferrimicrobium sp.]|nr:metalloregulator ArsR/SmtB family transcription factor [Candidatus Deferrimicrobium sp.]
MIQRVPVSGVQDIGTDWNSVCEEQAKFVSVLVGLQRIKILRLLRGGEQCVCEIERALGIPQNLVSHHLRVLREAGLVSARKEGQFVYYSRVEDRILQLTQALTGLLST